MTFQDKTIIITGGGKGIGRGITERFADQGATVIICGRREPETLPPNTHFISLDIREPDAAQKLVEFALDRTGRIDCLINNAGGGPPVASAEASPRLTEKIVALNLMAPIYLAQAAYPHLKGSGGSIINMGSIAWIIGKDSMPCYMTAKSAVEGMTRSLARAFGPDNIRVNTVLPGWIITQRQEEMWFDETSEKTIFDNQCLKRILVPEDMLGPLLFLASDTSSACTNQRFIVDGGWV